MVKKDKKPSMKTKYVVNMHALKMKGVVLLGKTDGTIGGPPTTEPLKKVQKKKLKKAGDQITRVPLTMSSLTRQGKKDINKASKTTRILVLN